MVVDGKLLIGNEDGKLTIFKADGAKAEVVGEYDTRNYSSIYSTPTISDGVMYLSDRSGLLPYWPRGEVCTKLRAFQITDCPCKARIYIHPKQRLPVFRISVPLPMPARHRFHLERN